MIKKTVSIAFIAISTACIFAQTNETAIPESNSDGYAKIFEGTISSVDIENNTLVLKAKVTYEDTIHIDKNAIIRTGSAVSSRRDLNPHVIVQAHYEIKNGAKLATVVLTRPDVSFLPDTTELGNSVLIAEGTIRSIDPSRTLMIIQAPLEREYVFSLDPKTIIKSGIRPIPLKDLKPSSSVKVSFTEKGARKIAKSVITHQ